MATKAPAVIDRTGNLPTASSPSNPMELMAMVIERGGDVATLERLVELKERTDKTQSAQDFASAVSAFQGECPQIGKDRRTDRFSYASYDDIMHQIQPLLAKHGLSVSFDMEQTSDGSLACTCIVSCGIHSQKTHLTMPIGKELKVSATQQHGAAVSYVRRYALCAALNIVVTSEDREEHIPGVTTISSEQQTLLYNLIGETDTDLAAFLGWAGVEELSLMPANKYAMAVQALNKKKVKQEAAK